MCYLMKQRFFSLGGAFHVKDEQGRDVFEVQGAALSFGHRLTFRDASGGELAFIRQKLLNARRRPVPVLMRGVACGAYELTADDGARRFKLRRQLDKRQARTATRPTACVCDGCGGRCTLRAAIEQPNASAGTDTISFQMGSGVQHITVNGLLPVISDPVVIDGTT
jgi:LURP-one-related